MRSQLVVALWYRANGWGNAESAGSGRPGIDVLGMPALAPEVKARRAFSPLAWLKQAAKAAGTSLPFVVIRFDGQGEESVARWGVLMTLEDHTRLLRQAGYGDPEES